jgi:glycosyltransferase involved in cell wall biosynthesis
MKILHVIDSGGLYGAEMMLLNLASEQLSRGLKPVIASIGDLKSSDKAVEIAAIERGLPLQKFRFRAGFNLLGALKIVNYAKSQSFDLLHSHGYKGNILLGFLPRRFRPFPLVSTLHGWTSTGGFTKIRLYELLDSISLNFVDRVALVNTKMLNHGRVLRLSPKPVVIDNGISLEEIDSPVLNPNIVKFCQRGRTLCAIGRLSSEKGFDYLIMAMSQLIDTYPDLQLLILGEGRERSRLEAMVEDLNLSRAVMLPGYQKNASSHLKICTSLVMSSLTEGLPITLLEAMRANKPIVATRVGGIPDVIEHGRNGILVTPASSNSLVVGVKELLQNDMSHMTAVAYSKFKENYTSELMTDRYLTLYESVM